MVQNTNKNKNRSNSLNCTVDGVQYQSRTEAAKQYGRTPQLVYERLKSGKTLDEAVREYPKIEKIPIDLSNGHSYDSFRSACEGENIPYGTAMSRYHQGFPLDKVFAKGKQYRDKVTVQGKEFSSKKRACEYYNVNYKSATSYMRRKQCDIEAAILHLKGNK